jgi:RsiW-degrading membrane proteinase PrsW (M82 family)
MVSISWVIWFFLIGGLAGLVIAALMGMAAREEDRALQLEGAIREQGPLTLI